MNKQTRINLSKLIKIALIIAALGISLFLFNWFALIIK